MRRAKIARFLHRTGAGWALRAFLPWSGVLCLNYHRIGNPRECQYDRGVFSATAEQFDNQVRFLKSEFDLISPGDLSGVVAKKRGKHLLITFDDGYRDNYALAYPILKRWDATATFFIATGVVDRPVVPWWDEIAWMIRQSQRSSIELPSFLDAPLVFDEPERERAIWTALLAFKTMPSVKTAEYLEALRDATGSRACGPEEAKSLFVTWDMIREMHKNGMTIGGHTVTHSILGQMPRGQQRHEIIECGRRLEQELGEPMRYFSYPHGKPGSFNEETQACLAEAGVQYAFSFYRGFRRFQDWADYDVRRVGIEAIMTPEWFKAIVSVPQLFTR